MKLKNIVIINRAPFNRLELDLENENIILLSGVNGAGKTTIISYIVDALYELARKGFANEFEEISSKFYRISSALFSMEVSKFSIVYLRFLQDDMQHADYIDINGECTEEQYNSIMTLPNKIDYSKLQHALKNEGVVKYWTITDKQKIREVFANNLLTYFPAYRYETPYYLNGPYKIALKFTKDFNVVGYLTNPIEVTSDLPDIANWIMDVVLDQHIYQGQATTVLNELNIILTNILFNKTRVKTRLGIGPRYYGANRIAVMENTENKRQIYPSIFSMSSGELALLCLFGELLKQTDKIKNQISKVSGIVLIDEIDKHLHIKLQKEVLPTLIKMFPNVQFIASSHSPFISLGLAEANDIVYKLYDLENDGVSCLPQDNDLFKEVYEMMITENDRYAAKLQELRTRITNDDRPLIITEGKTDWKILKAAMQALKISDLDIEFYEYEDSIGDKTLKKLLDAYARINKRRVIIGVFDRDNFAELKIDQIDTLEYVSLKNRVYAFAIPLVNETEYGTNISIEHYFKKCDLTKLDENDRRLFLGWEFYSSGFSKDGRHHTRISNIENKVRINGIIDDKVYEVNTDPEEIKSVALSKNRFADLVLELKDFSSSFDFSEFKKIFDVIRKIVISATK